MTFKSARVGREIVPTGNESSRPSQEDDHEAGSQELHLCDECVTPQRARRRAARGLLVSLAVLVSLGLFGCAATRMKADFTSYENAYAVTSNQEVLMNLARLYNHDPTYFFKMGQISTSYRMEGSLSGSGLYSPFAGGGNNPPTGVSNGGGTPGVIFEKDPAFTFIPVNDDTNAQFLLRPISAETFYTLYQQGWRLDQLFRLMVDRIELTVGFGQNDCQTEIIRNAPDDPLNYVRFIRASAILYALQRDGFLLLRGVNQFVPVDPDSYLVERTNGPNGNGSGSLSPPQASAPAGGAGSDPPAAKPSADSSGSSSSVVTASDINTAWGKNTVWELRDGRWQLGQENLNPVFLLNPPFVSCDQTNVSDKIADTDSVCPDLQQIEERVQSKDDTATGDLQDKLSHVPGLLHLVLEGLLRKGFSIEETSGGQVGIQPCRNQDIGGSASSGKVAVPGILKITLVMRPLLGLMAAAAQEQDEFDNLLKSDDLIPPDPLLDRVNVWAAEAKKAAVNANETARKASATDQAQAQKIAAETQLVADQLALMAQEIANAQPSAKFRDLVPEVEQLPLLRLKWDATSTPAPAQRALISVNYNGNIYSVADDSKPTVTANRYWNRDMFRLIGELSAQVTVDISKFPLPEVLQLHTD